jgi:hypothetical protein
VYTDPTDPQKTTPLVSGLGRQVEVCVASAFWLYMANALHVKQCIDTDAKDLYYFTGAGTAPNTSVANASSGFVPLLWQPVKALTAGQSGYPGTSELLTGCQASLDPAAWSVLNGYLQSWKLA